MKEVIDILAILDTINNLTEEQQSALFYARQCVEKEIPRYVIINTDDMDENCNDYSYVCPLCGCNVHDENESVGMCSCGQHILIPDIVTYLEDFVSTHKYNYGKRRWVKTRKRLLRG